MKEFMVSTDNDEDVGVRLFSFLQVRSHKWCVDLDRKRKGSFNSTFRS